MIKKGTLVWLVKNYDSKGTVAIRQCVVDSWGKQQAHMRQLDGNMTKHRISQTMVNRAMDVNPEADYKVYEVGTVDVEARALELAAAIITHRRTHYEACIARNNQGPGAAHYLTIMRKGLAEINAAVPHVIDITKR